MYIKAMDVEGYALFQDSGIRKIGVKYSSDIQIIIGANGCGKTSFLRQHSPFSSISSLFYAGSIKTQLIEKDGVIYRLETEFTKGTPKHHFYEEGSDENLNVGKTDTAQKKLIETHLGVTPLVDDLIMNRYNFPTWGNAKRKDFIMSINPADVGFIQVELKKISGKIKACKNNLSRLKDRKLQLEQDILSPDTLADIKQEKLAIDHQLSSLQQALLDIEVGGRVLIPGKGRVTETFKKLRYRLWSTRHALLDLKGVPHDLVTRQSLRNDYTGKISAGWEHIKHLEDEASLLQDKIHDASLRYRELAPDEDVSITDENIRNLEKSLEEFRTTRPKFEISQEDLIQGWTLCDTLRDKLMIFEDCQVPLYSRKKMAHRSAIQSKLDHRLNSYRMQLSDLRSRHESLSNRRTLSPRDIPDNPCSKDKCPLYAHFMSDYEETETKLRMNQIKIKRLEHKHNRAETLSVGLYRYFKDTKPYYDAISDLIDLASQNPILRDVLKSMDILHTLRRNASIITRRLSEEYAHIDRWLRFRSIERDLDVAHALKVRQISSQSTDAISLVTSIEDMKKALSDLRDRILTISANIKTFKEELANLDLYDRYLKDINEITVFYETKVRNAVFDHETKSLALLKDMIELKRSSLHDRLGEINRTLREQDSIQARYTYEILGELETIAQDQFYLEHIEKTLILIPKETTIRFLNRIFEQANRIIESVWTLPLSIDLLTMDDNLNYDFQVTGDNNSKRELSDCSTGQTEILTLAINLAIRIQLGYFNYPLCLDECGASFDDTHKRNLTNLLKALVDDKTVSQLFMVNHHAVVHEGFHNSEYLVIRDDNVTLPSSFNTHVTFEKV